MERDLRSGSTDLYGIGWREVLVKGEDFCCHNGRTQSAVFGGGSWSSKGRKRRSSSSSNSSNRRRRKKRETKFCVFRQKKRTSGAALSISKSH